MYRNRAAEHDLTSGCARGGILVTTELPQPPGSTPTTHIVHTSADPAPAAAPRPDPAPAAWHSVPPKPHLAV